MLPIYKAFSITEYAIEGGSSLPCIMSVIDDEGNILKQDFVVKVYRATNWSKTYYEVFGSVLAIELGLQTPKPALIDIPQNILNELKKHPKYEKLDLKAGIYFGSEYLPNATSFNPNFPMSQYALWSLESIFAFDVLIRNFDRRAEKPNLLSFKKDLFVIDHEMAFASITSSMAFEVEKWHFILNSNNSGHALRLFLKKNNEKNKVEFAEFFENFRTLQPNILYSYMEQLVENDLEPIDIQEIISYLCLIKQKTQDFATLLNTLLLH